MSIQIKDSLQAFALLCITLLCAFELALAQAPAAPVHEFQQKTVIENTNLSQDGQNQTGQEPGRTPRDFRGHTGLLVLLALAILLAFAGIHRALHRAKKSGTKKAWHE